MWSHTGQALRTSLSSPRGGPSGAKKTSLSKKDDRGTPPRPHISMLLCGHLGGPSALRKKTSKIVQRLRRVASNIDMWGYGGRLSEACCIGRGDVFFARDGKETRITR